MSDIADMSDDRIQHAIDDGIREARRAKSLIATGQCFNCAESVPHGYLFCCGECREDWEVREAAKARNGR